MSIIPKGKTIMESPFKYGVTVSSKHFTNRERESKKLYQNLTQGINTTIISPRRWGKSSLVEKVVVDINRSEKNTTTIIIDLFSVADAESFLETFAREIIKASSNKWEDWVKSSKDFFKQLVPKISFGVDPQHDFKIGFDWNEISKHRNEILNLPEIIATKKNTNFIICLDEFQNIAEFKQYAELEKEMRSIWQRQKNVTYCLYGSKRHMMSNIFDDSSKPFYRFGDLMHLNKIKNEKWIQFIVKGFSSTNKSISKENAALIANKMKDAPWYVQQLAHYTWQSTDSKTTKTIINNSLSELIAANSPFYANKIESMSKTQTYLLIAIANGTKQLTSTKAMQQYKIGTPRNVSKNKAFLINEDIVHEINGKFEFVDPAFEMWFLKEFLNKDYKIR